MVTQAKSIQTYTRSTMTMLLLKQIRVILLRVICGALFVLF